MMMITVLCLVILGCLHKTDAVCTFPSDLRNSVWTSTEFGDITFETSVAQFVDTGETLSSNWTCHVSSGDKYVLQSLDVTTSASLGTDVYFYYCFDLYQQSTNSYLYYHPTALLGGIRRLQLGTATTTVSFACSESIATGEYHVMVKTASASSVKNFCVSPLLGNFLYACTSGSTDNGTLNVCDTSSQTTLTFNQSQCSSSEVVFSAGGVLNCVAQTSTTISSETVYYQTLYNTDATVNGLTTTQFVCLAVTQDSSGAVFFSYNALACISGQTSTTTTSPVQTFEQLVATELCPIVETTSSKSNTGLIVGLVVGLVLLLLLIVGALIFYFCFYKRDPNAGKPIVENTKPRFEEEPIEIVDLEYASITKRKPRFDLEDDTDSDRESDTNSPIPY